MGSAGQCTICFEQTEGPDQQEAGLCARHLSAEERRIYRAGRSQNEASAQKKIKDVLSSGVTTKEAQRRGRNFLPGDVRYRLIAGSKLAKSVDKAVDTITAGEQDASGQNVMHNKFPLFNAHRVRARKLG